MEPHNLHIRDIKHLVHVQLESYYGLLNSEDHGKRPLRHDKDVDDLEDELQLRCVQRRIRGFTQRAASVGARLSSPRRHLRNCTTCTPSDTHVTVLLFHTGHDAEHLGREVQYQQSQPCTYQEHTTAETTTSATKTSLQNYPSGPYHPRCRAARASPIADLVQLLEDLVEPVHLPYRDVRSQSHLAHHTRQTASTRAHHHQPSAGKQQLDHELWNPVVGQSPGQLQHEHELHGKLLNSVLEEKYENLHK